MEQDIRYCTAADGVRIAYSTAGSGPPLVVSSAWVGHLEFEWSQPAVRSFWERLARGRTLVRYDKRGTGLSDWEPPTQSLDARVGDLGCVVDALRLEHFDLMGLSEGGATAITYAARFPKTVDRLILYGAYPRLETTAEFRELLLPLVRAEWGMGSAALSSVFVPSSDPAEVAGFTALQRISTSGGSAARMLEMIGAIDITSLLRDVAASTLVLHRKGDVLHPFDLAREIAATIPNARLVPLEGDVYPPWFGDSAAVIRAVHAFLGTEPGMADVRTSASAGDPSGTAVILFTDIADSTALTERMGDAAFRAASRSLDATIRAAIRNAGGSPVEGKVMGDGVMGVFRSAADAIGAARRCLELGGELPMHIGLHAGDVIREDDNVYGGAVNIASRICGLCEPGEVLVSATIRDLARTSTGVTFEDRGDRSLKGIDYPVRVFAITGEP